MIDPVSRQGRSHGSRSMLESKFASGPAAHEAGSRLPPDKQREGAGALPAGGNSAEQSNPEDRYCSSCGWPDECARNRSCHRRDAGEIRSPYSGSARGDLTPSAQPDAGATSSSSDAPRPESVSYSDPGASRHGSGSGLLADFASGPAAHEAGSGLQTLSQRAAFSINHQSAVADVHRASCGAAPSGASSPTLPDAPDAACPVLLEGGVDD